MNDNYKAVRLFDKAAELYQKKYMNVQLYHNSVQHFCAGLAPGASIIDIGCGPGNILKNIFENNQHFKLSGIDLSPKMISLAEKNVPSAQFQVGDCMELENLIDKYDGVICNFLIPYFQADEVLSFLPKIYNILSKSGKLLLGFIADENNRYEMVQSSVGDSLLMNYYELPYIENLLLSSKFRIIHNAVYNSPNPNQIQKDVLIIAQK